MLTVSIYAAPYTFLPCQPQHADGTVGTAHERGVEHGVARGAEAALLHDAPRSLVIGKVTADK